MKFSFRHLPGYTTNKPATEKTKKKLKFIAKEMKIEELGYELSLFAQNKTEFDIIGITSNGIDCIYFIKNTTNFDIEFEAIAAEQIPFITKLAQFGKENQYSTLIHSYGNKPHYKSDKHAPVIKIVTNSDIKNTVEIATKIQSEIFENNNETRYNVVP